MFSDNPDLKRIILNAIWFKVGWLACIFLGNKAAWVVLPMTLLLHFYVIPLSLRQWSFIGLLTLIGYCFDTILSFVGILEFNNGMSVPSLWLITLWILFSSLLLVTLHPLILRRSLFIPLCSIGGMASYTAGVAISESTFGFDHSIAMPLVAIAWAGVGLVIENLYFRLIHSMEKSYA